MRLATFAAFLFFTMLFSLFLFLAFSKGRPQRFALQRRVSVPVDVEGIMIVVKTTAMYHESRVRDIVDTWFQLASDNIYFVTDVSDAKLNESTRYHAVISNCGHGHTREGLCCKMNAELELFMAHNPSWACHFDDDNYVHIVRLVETLRQFSAARDWYLGKPSTTGPVDLDSTHNKAKFWFATGGAGFCISRSLLMKMSFYVRNGGFELLGEHLRLPDDVTLGYLIEHLLNVKLTVVDKFHSHLEVLKEIDINEMDRQVSFSAGTYGNAAVKNVVNVPLEFPPEEDPQRFRSLHCFLYGICRLPS